MINYGKVELLEIGREDKVKRIIGLLIGIIGIVYLFSGSQKVVQAAPKSLRQVVADQVQYGDYTLQLKLIAQAENPQFSNLQSLYPGQVSTILVKEGQAIKKGKPLVCLDDTQAVLDDKMVQKECHVVGHQMTSAEQELARLKARLTHQTSVLEQAKNRFERMTRLKEKGHVSDHEFEQEKSTWAVRQSENEALMGQYEQAMSRKQQISDQINICESKQLLVKKRLDDLCLKAPSDGDVVEIFVSKGQMVSASTPMVQFSGIDDHRLYAMVLSSQLAVIDRGVKKVSLIDMPGSISYEGIVESQNGTFQLKFIGNGSFWHGKAYEILMDLAPVEQSVLIDDAILYDGKYVFSLLPVVDDVYQLVKQPVDCFGYHWQNNERFHVCVFKNKQPERILKTRITGALDGMQVRIS
jgi:multidrug efflux pump subunit AcrA (membrane-fusion protein)